MVLVRPQENYAFYFGVTLWGNDTDPGYDSSVFVRRLREVRTPPSHSSSR